MLTIRELIKTLYNALLQRMKKYRGNWEQNDPTADDYIKNRPFYTDEINKEIVVKTKTFTATSSYWWGSPFTFIPVVGETYKVTWDGKEYICQSYLVWGDSKAIGNISIINDDGSDTGEPFFYYRYDSSDYGLCVRYQGKHTITIEKIDVKKLDKRYLPDLGLAPVATSGSYNDLSDKPTIYTDVVRYGTTQSLTAAQKKTGKTNIGAVGYDTAQSLTTTNKTIARTNIGAVGYESQSLTDTQKAQARTNIEAISYVYQYLNAAQKTQARTNIGAGTSNFSGSYSDLTNKPTIPTVPSDIIRYGITQSLNKEDQERARENIGAGTSNFDGDYNKLIVRKIYVAETEPNYNQLNINRFITIKHDENDLLVKCNDGDFFEGGYSGTLGSEGIQKLMFDICNPLEESFFFFPDGTNLLKAGHIYGFVSAEEGVRLAKPHETIYRTMKVTRTTGNYTVFLIDVPATILPETNIKNSITFLDQVNGYHYIACMRDGNFVTYCAAKSIEVTTMPTKTEYIAGEYFDPTGMTVVVTAYDGTTKEITDFTYPSSYILEGDTFVEVKYVEGGITHIATVPITVTPFDPAVVLVDFEYTINDDGTYTLTSWKETYNGEASTELIIPNNGLIIV